MYSSHITWIFISVIAGKLFFKVICLVLLIPAYSVIPEKALILLDSVKKASWSHQDCLELEKIPNFLVRLVSSVLQEFSYLRFLLEMGVFGFFFLIEVNYSIIYLCICLSIYLSVYLSIHLSYFYLGCKSWLFSFKVDHNFFLQ